MLENEEVKDNTEEIIEDKSALDILSEGMDGLFEEKTEEVEDEQLETEDSTDEKSEDDELDAEAKDTQEESTDEEVEPIPEAQVDIARKLGYGDDEIIKLAETSPERLEKMVELYSKPDLSQRETQQVVVPKKEEVKETPKLDHLSIDDFEELEPESAKIVKKILEKTNAIVDRNNELEQKVGKLGEHALTIEERNQAEANRKIDNYFDESSEFVTEVGLAKSLTPSQVAARNEIYGMSVVLQNSRGISETEALNEATYLFGLNKMKIEDIEKQAEERVKEKLNKQKKKMSPRPGGKKTVKTETKGREAAVQQLSEGLKEIFGSD